MMTFLFTGCYDSYIYVLKVSTGEIHWKFKTGDVVKCSPVMDPLTSLIWVGSHDDCIYSLDVKVIIVIISSFYAFTITLLLLLLPI